MNETLPAEVKRTTIDTSTTAKGKTYYVGHGIEHPDGTLHGYGRPTARLPKLWDDPAYAPRLIRALAKEQNVPEEQIGKPVIVAIVRVDKQ